MKFEPVTKLDKRNRAMQKKLDDVMSASCDIIDIFLIYGQFEAICNPDYGCMVCETYIFINSNLLQKLKTELKNL